MAPNDEITPSAPWRNPRPHTPRHTRTCHPHMRLAHCTPLGSWPLPSRPVPYGRGRPESSRCQRSPASKCSSRPHRPLAPNTRGPPPTRGSSRWPRTPRHQSPRRRGSGASHPRAHRLEGRLLARGRSSRRPRRRPPRCTQARTCMMPRGRSRSWPASRPHAQSSRFRTSLGALRSPPRRSPFDRGTRAAGGRRRPDGR